MSAEMKKPVNSNCLADPSGDPIVIDYVRRFDDRGAPFLVPVGERDLSDEIQMAAESCTLVNVLKILKRNPGADLSAIVPPVSGDVQFGDDQNIPNNYRDAVRLSQKIASTYPERIESENVSPAKNENEIVKDGDSNES